MTVDLAKKPFISDNQKNHLAYKGYYIEDMEKVWGSEYQGQYRWMNDLDDGDGFGVIQYSETAAWLDAAQYDLQLAAADE